MMDEKTDAELLRELGGRLRSYRLQQNLPAEVVAARAGVSRTTLHGIEAGHDARLGSLLRVLRALGRLDALDAFLPVSTVSPMQMLRRGTVRRRERARRQRSSAPGRPVVPGAPVLPPGGTRSLTDESSQSEPDRGE
jgi:transcriptional regulator with XRE-family HTH domain